MRKFPGHLNLIAVALAAAICFVVVGALGTFPSKTLNAAPSQSRPEPFVANLIDSNVVPPSTSGATARAVLVMSQTLDYRVIVTGTGTISTAALYAGTPGSNGIPLFTLYDSATSPGPFDHDHPLVGSMDLAVPAETALRAEGAYIQIETVANPSGETRGQLLAAPLPHLLSADLNGADEIPPVTTSASGTYSGTISEFGTDLAFSLEALGLVDISMSHIHRGLAGTNGPPTTWLYDAAGVNAPGGTFDDTHPISGTMHLQTALLADVMAHMAYVNVHTVSHSGGEIRGQVRLEAAPQGATPTASASPSPTHTPADPSATPTGGPSHTPTDVSTPSETPGGPTGTPTETPSDPSATPSTPASPTSEPITGTPTSDAPTETAVPSAEPSPTATFGPPPLAFSSDLMPATTSVTADGSSGWMYAVLDAESGTLHYRIGVTTTETITAAQLHEGENGPVVAWLYDSTGAEAPGGTFGTDDPLRGSIPASAHVAHLLETGGIHLSVNTAEHPAGQSRGALTTFTPTTYGTRMVGIEEVPPVNSTASGTARINVLANQRLDYVLAVENISGIILAHLHLGREGTAGPPVVTLYSASGVGGPSGPFDPDHDFAGSAEISPESLADLVSGFLYVNVHTVAHPGGEIRGQASADVTLPEFEASLPFVEGVAGGSSTQGFGSARSLACILASPAAISGRGETGIQVQNLSATTIADAVTEFRTGGGTLALSIPDEIDPLAAINIWLPGQPLPAGHYGGRVRANQRVGAIVRTDWPASGGAAIYSNVEPSTNAALPLAVRHYLGQTSRIAVQNAADEAALVTIIINEVGEATAALTETLTLAPRGMQIVDLEGKDGLGERFLGALSARSNVPIAMQSFVDITTSEKAVYGFEAMPVDRAARRLYAPLFRAKQFPRGGDPSSGRLDTGISVLNPNAETAHVTVTYHGSRDRAASVACRGGTFTSPTAELPPNSSHVFYQGDPPAQGLPEDCFGAAVIDSDQPVLAIVNDSLNEGGAAAAYNAVAEGATRVALPLYRREHAGGLSTGIQAMNLGTTAARVQIRFMRQNPDGTTTEILGCGDWCDVTVEPGEGHTWWPPNQPVLESNTYGAAFIESTEPIAVIVNDVVVTGARDMATYNGIGVR